MDKKFFIYRWFNRDSLYILLILSNSVLRYLLKKWGTYILLSRVLRVYNMPKFFLQMLKVWIKELWSARPGWNYYFFLFVLNRSFVIVSHLGIFRSSCFFLLFWIFKKYEMTNRKCSYRFFRSVNECWKYLLSINFAKCYTCISLQNDVNRSFPSVL